MRGNEPELLGKIAEGDWSDETQAGLEKAVERYAEDFGFDLDEEGHPLEDSGDEPPPRREEQQSDQSENGSGESDESGAKEEAEEGRDRPGLGRREDRPSMAKSQRDVRNRISSVKNIQKITRAMEMVAAARLRRAEQRIEALRPYAARSAG